MGKIVDASHSILGYIIYQVPGFSFCDLYFWERLYPSVQSSSGQAADATVALFASTSSSLWFQHGFFFQLYLVQSFWMILPSKLWFLHLHPAAKSLLLTALLLYHMWLTIPLFAPLSLSWSFLAARNREPSTLT